MRKAVIAGNWKMHKTLAETKNYLSSLREGLKDPVSSRILLAIPFPFLFTAVEELQGLKIEIGAQNMSEYEKGAYTGEVSASMIHSCGAGFVLLGHSERRQLFQETSQKVSIKVKRALAVGLQPVVCIGETETQRAEGQTEFVLHKQIEESLDGLTADEVGKILLAYEPVWAIGTGKNATPGIAQQTHHLCRLFIEKRWGQKVASSLSILYGGSVKAEHMSDLMKEPDIDGVLVGGASLEAASFLNIIYYQ